MDLSNDQHHGHKEEVNKLLHRLCAGYVGLTDSQATFLVAELLDAFPDAVVICTQRDADKWWASMEPVLKTTNVMKALNLLFIPVPTVRYFGAWVDALGRR